jgi:Holliday junction resolvase RusA-like endonuclease
VTVLRFTIPGRPLGVNELYERSRNGQVRKSDKARAFEQLVALVGTRARRAQGWETTMRPVEVSLRIFFDSERPDIDGPEKLILDALQAPRAHRVPAHRRVGAGIIANDRQVRRKLTEREVDRERPRIEVAVGPVGEVFALATVLRGQQAGGEG